MKRPLKILQSDDVWTALVKDAGFNNEAPAGARISLEAILQNTHFLAVEGMTPGEARNVLIDLTVKASKLIEDAKTVIMDPVVWNALYSSRIAASRSTIAQWDMDRDFHSGIAALEDFRSWLAIAVTNIKPGKPGPSDAIRRFVITLDIWHRKNGGGGFRRSSEQSKGRGKADGHKAFVARAAALINMEPTKATIDGAIKYCISNRKKVVE